ncbi:hypothetical protein BJX68DRAFT_37639 [Aspergillus pseudodeflectus]|uniref:Uncharacterized protein n=1 Tax=Aspergillus pseudodeflectus TaxID=176178 RepID=A0ABR4J8X9_9EURO
MDHGRGFPSRHSCHEPRARRKLSQKLGFETQLNRFSCTIRIPSIQQPSMPSADGRKGVKAMTQVAYALHCSIEDYTPQLSLNYDCVALALVSRFPGSSTPNVEHRSQSDLQTQCAPADGIRAPFTRDKYFGRRSEDRRRIPIRTSPHALNLFLG